MRTSKEKRVPTSDRSGRKRSALLRWALVLCAGAALQCGPAPAVKITSPADGAFTNAASVSVSGDVTAVDPAAIAALTVNGASALPLESGGHFTATVPLSAAAIFNPIVAELRLTDGRVLRDRVTLVVGDGVTTGSVADGAASPDSVAMRFGDAGLAQVTPIVEQLSGGALDIGGMITAQNPILDDACVVESLGNCLYFATANVVEVGFGDFSLAADAIGAGATRTTVSIDDFHVEIDLNVRDLVALDITCGLEISASAATITGDFAMEPKAGEPSKVDVRQIGGVSVALGGFESRFISGTCTEPVIGDIIQLLVSPSMIEGMVKGGFESNLADPDGAGPTDSPIAAAIETALGGVSIAGPIGAAVGADFDAEFSAITEDADGITFAAGAAITNPAPAAGAPDLPASYTVAEPFPTFGAVTPVSSEPYGLALAISTSAFNQLLEAQVEGGLLRADLTSFDLGGGAVIPLTAGVLGLFIPEFARYPVMEPIVVSLRPQLAPILTGAPGPGGELAEMRIAGLRVEIRMVANNVLLLGTIVDADLGVNLSVSNGALGFSLGAVDAGDIHVTLVDNPQNVNESNVLAFLPGIFPFVMPTLAGALGSFPLPEFLGLSLEPVEVGRAGEFIALYLNFAMKPATHLENFVLTDLSTADFKVDGGFDQNEWRHRVSGKATATSVAANLKGVVGADACCTTGDKTGAATAAYRVAFDVVGLAGETWTLDVSHAIAGAYTLQDERVAQQDAGGHARFNGPVSATYRVNGGAPVAFGFTPSPSSATNGVGCTPAILFCGSPNPPSGDRNVPFTGSAATQISGTGNAAIQIDFGFALEAFSNSNLTFPAAGGDEVALRLGKNDTLGDGFDVGAYPGWGGRNIADDGHRVSVQLSVTPAP